MFLNYAVAWDPRDDGWSDREILKLIQDMSMNNYTSLPQLKRISIFDVDNWFENWQLFEILEEIPRDIEVRIIRRVPLLWDF